MQLPFLSSMRQPQPRHNGPGGNQAIHVAGTDTVVHAHNGTAQGWEGGDAAWDTQGCALQKPGRTK